MFAREIARGLMTTFRELLDNSVRGDPVTYQYPEEKRPIAQRFKGRHVLKRYDNGLEKCIGCSLCAAACPANAIFVEASENSDEVRFSPGERYASTYEINFLRCIFCGYCVEACPREAIEMTTAYEISEYSRKDLIMTKEQLMEPPTPRYEEVTVKKAG